MSRSLLWDRDIDPVLLFPEFWRKGNVVFPTKSLYIFKQYQSQWLVSG